MRNEDEELDNVLELEFSASFHPQKPVSSSPATDSEAPTSDDGGSSGLLTFRFPGWGVDMFRDQKRKKPSIVRHHLSEKARERASMEMEELELPLQTRSTKLSGMPSETPSEHGNHVYTLPDEIVVNVMKRLSLSDLCCATQTCHWWQHIGLQDDVWERFCKGMKDATAPGSLPNWAIVKNAVLLNRVKKKVASRFAYLCKGFDHLRSTLRLCWETNWHDAQLSSKSLHSLIRKMTAHDWPIFYEFIAVVFSERADSLGNVLMDQLVKATREYSKDRNEIDHVKESSSACFHHKDEKVESMYNFSVGKLFCERQENIIGRELWKHVITLWNQYKQWLLLVSTHCPELNYAVLSERARSTAWSTTPNVYDKGVICFRGQVLLKYRLRRVLQSGFSLLTARGSDGTASELEVELLRSIYYLLQEVDVLDDFCLSTNLFTQSKLKRCFPIKRFCSKVVCC